MHQNAFGGRALPRPAGGAYSARPDPIADLGGREGMGGKEEGEGEGRRGKRGEEKRGGPPNV